MRARLRPGGSTGQSVARTDCGTRRLRTRQTRGWGRAQRWTFSSNLMTFFICDLFFIITTGAPPRLIRSAAARRNSHTALPRTNERILLSIPPGEQGQREKVEVRLLLLPGRRSVRSRLQWSAPLSLSLRCVLPFFSPSSVASTLYLVLYTSNLFPAGGLLFCSIK